MAGTLLSPDQIRKINQAFPALMAHIRALLAADHSGVGLMRVHCMVETFDTDEMSRIFREVPFISPREKLALVRAAIYELMAKEPALFIAPLSDVEAAAIVKAQPYAVPVENMKIFTPPQFSLNINKSADFHGQAPADTPKPAPIVTSTHVSKVAEQLKAGDEEKAAQQAKIDAAVIKLHEASKPIELAVVPEDATLPEVELPELKD